MKTAGVRLTDGLTDEQILDRICATKGCVNFCEQGIILCETCQHGEPDAASPAVARRKRQLEKRGLVKREIIGRESEFGFDEESEGAAG